MIIQKDKDIIINYARKYNASCVYLFGSSLEEGKDSNDIDIGVRIEPGLFFDFYAELFKHLSKPVDVVDISKKTLFNDLIEENGMKIYG